MDASRFDAWTRRRFGTAAAGIVAGVLGLGADREMRPEKEAEEAAQAEVREAGNPV